jgi:hypothetical protein
MFDMRADMENLEPPNENRIDSERASPDNDGGEVRISHTFSRQLFARQ